MSIWATQELIIPRVREFSLHLSLKSLNMLYSIALAFVAAETNLSSHSINSSVTYLFPLVICCLLFQSSGTFPRWVFVTSIYQPICLLCLTFRDGISNLALSLISRSLNHLWPTAAAFLKSSNFLSIPSLIIPPSLMDRGCSSFKLACISIRIVSSTSKSMDSLFRRESSTSPQIAFNLGILCSARPMATKSRPADRL